MKYGKPALILCLICALLLVGCSKQPVETPQLPETPVAPAQPGSDGPSQPVTPPEITVEPLQPPLTAEEEALLDAAFLREQMAELAESFLANSKTKSKIAMTYSSNSVKNQDCPDIPYNS